MPAISVQAMDLQPNTLEGTMSPILSIELNAKIRLH